MRREDRRAGERLRGRFTVAQNRAIVDLFNGADRSTFLHEMGHLAGKKDDGGAGAADDLMATFLALGVRRTNALDAVFGERG